MHSLLYQVVDSYKMIVPLDRRQSDEIAYLSLSNMLYIGRNSFLILNVPINPFDPSYDIEMYICTANAINWMNSNEIERTTNERKKDRKKEEKKNKMMLPFYLNAHHITYLLYLRCECLILCSIGIISIWYWICFANQRTFLLNTFCSSFEITFNIL